jgi:transposase
MDNSIRIPLDLPDVHVLDVSKTDQGSWLIRIESSLNGTTCHQCGRQIAHFHGFDQPVRVRHLPLFNTPVFIEFRPKRYECHECNGNPTTTQRLSWHELRSPNTKAYEQWLLRLLTNSTVADVARTLDVSDETVSGVLDRWVTRTVNWDEFEWLGIVGIDEISLRRGHRDYVALVIVPLESGGVDVLAVLGDRQQETVANFLASIPTRLKCTIERVCSDMYKGFVSAAQAQLPGAKIVIDR